MISVDEALATILDSVNVLGSESVPLDSVLGRVAAEDVHSPSNIPGFDASAMDGYAVRSADLEGATEESPIIVSLVGNVAAGESGDFQVEAGTAARILTGAPVPSGADAVVMQEWCKKTGDSVAIQRPVEVGENIRFSGDAIPEGFVVLRSGETLQAGEIGLLAQVGVTDVEVRCRPTVAVLATGDELRPVETSELGPGEIRESNNHSLAALIRNEGGNPLVLGIGPDNQEELKVMIRPGLEADCLLVTGGVSVGDRDFTEDILIDLGVEVRFHKVRVKPGKPLLFGVAGTTLVFGLPGNPASGMVTFLLFVAPALRKMQGRAEMSPPEVQAECLGTHRHKPGRREYVRAAVWSTPDGIKCRPMGPQGSGTLRSFRGANAFIEVPEEMSDLETGMMVKTLLWGNLQTRDPENV